MDLRLLRYFLAVCETGTLHGAAAVVHVAQPSLSRQIRRLEQDLGFALFDRSARGLSLTAAGRAFLPVAEDLLTRATHATATARSIARGTVSGLTVVAAPTTVADVISPFIVRAGADGVIGNAIEAMPEHVYSASSTATPTSLSAPASRRPSCDQWCSGTRTCGHRCRPGIRSRADRPSPSPSSSRNRSS